MHNGGIIHYVIFIPFTFFDNSYGMPALKVIHHRYFPKKSYVLTYFDGLLGQM